jgi:soluble lytic murein transglycosylase-like protein
MTTAPILRSAALQKALAQQPPARRAPVGPTFASTLASTRLPVQSRPKVTASAKSKVAPAVGPPLQPGESVPFQNRIAAAAAKYGLDPALLAAVVKQESNFNPNAKSGSGAKGLTQLMDTTARRLGVTDPFDPAQSLDGGAKFLSGLMKQFHGDQSLALAAYNAGPGAVQKYGGIPPYQETQRYVPKVLGYAAQFSRSWTGSSAAPATTS